MRWHQKYDNMLAGSLVIATLLFLLALTFG